MRLLDLLNTEANEIDLDRRREAAEDTLLTEGGLADELDESNARQLLGAVIRELYSARRDFDRTPENHVQTCYVFARAAIERAARRIIDRRISQ